MKKVVAFFLCISLCFFFIPLPMSATGTIQFKSILETEPDFFVLESATSVSDAVYNIQCSGVVVYSIDVEDQLPMVTDDFPAFEEKILILSDVTHTGYIGCRELYLFGNAKMIMENMTISGSSTDGTPKPALVETDLDNYENLRNAIEGIGEKYTITANHHIDYPLFCEDLEINEGVTLTIDAPSEGDGSNGIVVTHSLMVNGSLTAEDGQTLEIQQGCNTVEGLTLYEGDGTIVFTNYGTTTETFEYNAGEGKWIRRQSGGPPPIHFNDNHFQILFDDFTPDNGYAPEVKYRVDSGDDTAVPRDETVQFFQSGGSDITSIAFSMRPAQFEDGNYETFYCVRVTQGNAPENPVEYSSEDDTITYNSDTNTYFFTITPVEKGNDYEGFRVDIFWTEEAYNNEHGGGRGDPQNTYILNLDYNHEQGQVMMDRFDNNGPMYEAPGGHDLFEGSSVRVQIEPSQGYSIQEVLIDGESMVDDETQEPITWYDFDYINENHTVEVTFVRPEYTITVTHSVNGQVVALNGIEGVEDGSTATYTLGDNEHIRFRFIPDNGYKVSEILGDGNPEELSYEYEFNNIRENHALHVGFDKKGDGTMHMITVMANEGGTVGAEGLENGSLLVEDMFDHTFTFTPDLGYHLKSVIATGEGYEMDFTSYGVELNEEGFFTLILEELSQDLTLEVTFTPENAEDITFKKYVVTQSEDTPEKIAEALATEFGYVSYAMNPSNITVDNIDISGMDTAGYGTFDFLVTVGGTLVQEQGFIVPAYNYVLFEFEGANGGEPVDEIRVMTPENIDNMEFGVPAMDSGSIRVYGSNGFRLEGILSSDVRDAFIDGTRNEAVIGSAFYRAEWHMGNAYDMHDPRSLNLFGINLIQDNAFCVQVAASDGENEQRTFTWDLNRYAQLTTENYTSSVFFGNDIFTLRLPASGIGGVNSLVIETGEFPGYTILEDGDNQYILTFLSDFYDNITLTLLINGVEERELTVHRVGVEIQEVEKRPDSDFANTFHGTQYGTFVSFNGQNNYQLFATYYIPDFGEIPPFGLYVTYTWANGTTTTKIIAQPEMSGNAETGPDFDGVFRDDGFNNFVSCCDYRLYTAPDKASAPVKVNVIVLCDDPRNVDTFGGVYLGSGKGVEWTIED